MKPFIQWLREANQSRQHPSSIQQQGQQQGQQQAEPEQRARGSLLNVNEAEKILANAYEEDQRGRNALAEYYKKYDNWQEGLSQYKLDNNIQGDRVFKSWTNNLRELVDVIPYDELSEEGWSHLWMLAQHADDDRSLQQKYLKIILQYLGTDHGHYKYLYDRISCGLSGTQKYGTQNGCNKD